MTLNESRAAAGLQPVLAGDKRHPEAVVRNAYDTKPKSDGGSAAPSTYDTPVWKLILDAQRDQHARDHWGRPAVSDQAGAHGDRWRHPNVTAISAWRGAFIERLRATGNVTLAARGAGVSRQEVYKARNRNKTFRRLWNEALEEAVDLLDGEARRRATGIKKAVWYAGEVVGEESVYDSSLLMFLLRAHRPHLYRDNVRVEHPGGMEVTGDRKVTFEFVQPAEQQARTLAELAAEEAKKVEEAEAEHEAEEAP